MTETGIILPKWIEEAIELSRDIVEGDRKLENKEEAKKLLYAMRIRDCIKAEESISLQTICKALKEVDAPLKVGELLSYQCDKYWNDYCHWTTEGTFFFCPWKRKR